MVRGEPFYLSYLIVNRNSAFQTIEDLKGRVFAFTDPESNTGALVPKYWLARIGQSPDRFFKETVYTYSHDNSILAVARGLVDGAAVDGHKWEYYNRRNPYYTARTRVIKKSEPVGAPPPVPSSGPWRRKKRSRNCAAASGLQLNFTAWWAGIRKCS